MLGHCNFCPWNCRVDRVAGAKLTVRRARDGEQIETLDGRTRMLDPEMVLIEDEEGPTSIAGVMGSGSSIPYATSKAGLINLTRSLARSLAPEVRVNAVAPGHVDSPWQKDWPEDRKRATVERTPLKRACKTEDIAETIFFLCAGAAMITGQTVIVDGGLTL